jgi:type II secretory pathway component PulF
MKLVRLITLLMLALFAQSQAHAWSGPGHAAVAAMAYRDLASNPTLRNNLVNILRSHPRFNEWQNEFNLKKSGFPQELDLGMFLFIRAATWPDEIRSS